VQFHQRLCQTLQADSWPQFRGENSSAGLVTLRSCRMKIGPNTNVVWKTVLVPGAFLAVVWGDRIYVTGVDK